jgi:hypothetical protein
MAKQIQKTPKPFRLPKRTIDQLAELVRGGHCTNETAATVEAINYLYYHKVESANMVSLASRKIAETTTMPELSEHDGKLWLNLGSGLLAEGAAQMLVAQFPGDVETQQNALEEWLIWHRGAADDAYAMFRAIVMFRFE